MTSRPRFLVTCLVLAVAASSQTGCFWLAAEGPNLGPLAIPIPVPVGIQKAKEDQFWNYERYERSPILGPLQPGSPCEALDEPSDDEVMRALEKARPVQGNWPFLYEIQRNNVRITKCKIADYVDPPRHYPLVGPAQLHHAHYKCTVYYQEVRRVGWPVPHTLVDEDVQEVVYIDEGTPRVPSPRGGGLPARLSSTLSQGHPWPLQPWLGGGHAKGALASRRRASCPPVIHALPGPSMAPAALPVAPVVPTAADFTEGFARPARGDR